MAASLKLSLQVFDHEPVLGTDNAVCRQLWRGGATDLTTRTMMAEPPRWLALADYLDAGGAPVVAALGTPMLGWDLVQLLPGDRPSTDKAGGVILVSMNVDPAHEEEFNDWYNTEHMPHFSRVPGVIAARRFRALAGRPAYVALYHVEDTEVYRTPAWMAANETPWILRMRRFQRNRTYFMFRTQLNVRG